MVYSIVLLLLVLLYFIGHIYKGILINGSCQTCSQNDPNLMITIRDELYVGRDS